MTNDIKIGKKRESFDFKRLVKNSKYRKMNRKRAAEQSNRDIYEEYSSNTPNRIVPGNLCLFHYLEPKTKEQLEYYDAEPLTIFFGIAQTKDGKRVVGLNLHYYPPMMRKTIMEKILLEYGQFFKLNEENKYSISDFNWGQLNKRIKRMGLSFGIRMYIPSLMKRVTYVPVKSWPTAFYTEGAFEKKTRTMIMAYYWKKFLLG